MKRCKSIAPKFPDNIIPHLCKIVNYNLFKRVVFFEIKSCTFLELPEKNANFVKKPHNNAKKRRQIFGIANLLKRRFFKIEKKYNVQNAVKKYEKSCKCGTEKSKNYGVIHIIFTERKINAKKSVKL